MDAYQSKVEPIRDTTETTKRPERNPYREKPSTSQVTEAPKKGEQNNK
jgi:hypothetical protein